MNDEQAAALTEKLDALIEAQSRPTLDRANRVLSVLNSGASIVVALVVTTGTAVLLWSNIDNRVTTNATAITSIQTRDIRDLKESFAGVLKALKDREDRERKTEAKRQERHFEAMKLLTALQERLGSLQRAKDEADRHRP